MIEKPVLKIAGATVAALLAAELIGGLLFLASGMYNIAADQPHLTLGRWILLAAKTRSVQLRGRGQEVPNLRNKSLVKKGTALYGRNCQPCHGGPGIAAEQIGRGITPKPPLLAIAANNWTDSQLFWIISHGLKMSGMPAFDAPLSESDRWALVAFLRRMAFLSPTEYRQFAKAAELDTDTQEVHWISNDDYGFAQLSRRGNAAKGRELVLRYGCTTCHIVGDIGIGRVGPPLSDFAERQYIAGVLVNVPATVMAWVANPKRFKPQTAMPNLSVRPDEAAHIAAYLYTFGNQKRLEVLRKAATASQ